MLRQLSRLISTYTNWGSKHVIWVCNDNYDLSLHFTLLLLTHSFSIGNGNVQFIDIKEEFDERELKDGELVLKKK